jgi:hypothetical protein
LARDATATPPYKACDSNAIGDTVKTTRMKAVIPSNP